MIQIGDFLFHYRNGLFPLAYALLIFNSRPVFADYRVAALLGLLIGGAGQALRAATIGLDYIVRGGQNRRVYADKLVQGGIFAHCRNPLYVGNFLMIAGVGVASNSVLFLVVAIPFFLVAYRAIIAAEENYLRNKFGPDFDAYCARVNRLLPALSGLWKTLSGMRFNWPRLVSAEYGSTFIWIAATILVTLRNTWGHGDYSSSNPLVWLLWALLACALLAYATARFFKKSGYLAAAR